MKQQKGRKRSGAFPFELAFRLTSMYSVKGDRILDPFSGTGTTMAAAMACGRNSIGYEIDQDLEDRIADIQVSIIKQACKKNHQRLLNHVNFIQERIKTRGMPRYENIHYGFPVITNQEKKLILNDPLAISGKGPLCFQVEYSTQPQEAFCQKWPESTAPPMKKAFESREKQGSLF